MELFLGENLVGEGPITGSTDPISELLIGSDNGSYWSQSYIDEISIWNTALNESEIQSFDIILTNW